MQTREERRRDTRHARWCIAFFGALGVACALPDILTAVGL